MCFFSYSFPHFTWIFPLFPLLPTSLQNLLLRKYRVGIRLIHRCPFTTAEVIFDVTKEKPLELYVCKYLQKRLVNAHRTDLGCSLFYEDLFNWDNLLYENIKDRRKNESLRVGQFFQLSRVKKMKERHQSYLLTWIQFIENYSNRNA
jgi:hypothetical protein